MNGSESSTGRARQALPFWAAVLASALLLALGTLAHGTTLRLTLGQLATGADAIVLGTVASTIGQWDAEKSLIYTLVTLAVEEQYKGPPLSKAISILVLGGTVGEMGMTVSDMPRFTPGEQAVLFLKALSSERLAERRLDPAAEIPAPVFEVYGNFQGKLTVVEGRAGGVPLSDLKLYLLSLPQAPPELIPMTWEPEFFLEPFYALTGQRWPGDWPDVSYLIHTSFSDAENWAIRSSANTWSNAGARFTYRYAGTHTRAGGAQRNGVNEVVWADLGEGPTLGRGTWWFTGSTIIEMDVEFNTRHPFSTSTPPTQNDLESVSLHEFGHCLGLGHSDVPAAVMYPVLTIRTAKRTLHADDIAGVRAIYGTSTSPAGPALAVAPASREVGASAGTTTFSVTNTGSGTLNWTAAVTEGASWLQITSGASGTNAGTIAVAYAANTSTSARTGWITVTASGATGSPATVSVVQAGATPATNRPPTVSLRYSPANPTTADTLVFTATASDPDGDPLTYAWYLNGVRQTKVSPTASEVRWPNPREGTHTVRVVVSDGRGGSAEATVTVRVSAPGTPPGAGNSHTYGNVAGWYLISLPVPAGEPLPGITMWWNPATRSYERPASLSPLRGYWARLPANAQVSVAAAPPSTDQTLALNVAGWHMVSAPWPYPKAAIQVLRGTEVRSWAEAVAAGWVGSALYGYRAPDRAYASATVLDPWYGYWLKANVAGLSLRFVYASRAAALDVLEEEAFVVSDLQAQGLPPLPPSEPEALLDGLAFANIPNPVTDVHTTRFVVLGPMAGLVEAIRVKVFDLSGRLVWEGAASGAELTWHTDDLTGQYLANGVYLYRIEVKVLGEWVASRILKLVINR